MAEKTTFIYGLLDPRTGEIRYVGKTKNPERRVKQHVMDAHRVGPTTMKRRWLFELDEVGLEPELQVLAEVPRSEWKEAEKMMIVQLRADGAELYNITSGGAGGPIDTWGDNPERKELLSQRSKEMWKDPEFRRQYSEWSRTYWASEENRRRMSEIQRQAWADNDEAKAAISELRMKNWADPEYRQRVTESNLATWSDPELLAEHSERIAELWEDPGYREKTVAGMNDPDVIAQRKERLAEYWADPENREARSAIMEDAWKDLEFQEKHAQAMKEAAPKIAQALRDYYADPEKRAILSEQATERMADPARRDHLSEVAKAQWDDPEYREKQLRSRNRGKLRSDVAWAAEQLGVKKITVYKYCNQGRLGRKVDGSWCITEEDVEAFREGRACPSTHSGV